MERIETEGAGRSEMSHTAQYQHVGTYIDTDYYLAGPDILLVIPRAEFHDTPELARKTSDYMNDFARAAGKKLGTVVVLTNVLTQDAETRRVYQSLAGNGLYFGLALVVDSALSRALAGFFMGFSKPTIPTQLFGTVEKGIEWLKTIQPK